MNATVLRTRVETQIEEFGNSMVYHPPITTDAKFNDEGDWTPSYQTTTLSSKWVEFNTRYKNRYSEYSIFDLKEGEALIKGSEIILRKGKVVSNSINWEIVDIEPIRVKDVTIASIVRIKNILP